MADRKQSESIQDDSSVLNKNKDIKKINQEANEITYDNID